MSRQNQWFVPGNDIAREVITADIQRYLGPDALVRPGVGTGDHQGQPGYWITAYRTLTSQMIQDLRLDSQRWQAERQPEAGCGGGVAYQDSQTHAARQHWGPTTPYEQTQEKTQEKTQMQGSRSPYDDRRDLKQPPRSSYTAYGDASTAHYTTAPTPYEERLQSGYCSSLQPRTESRQYYPGAPASVTSGYYSSHPPRTESRYGRDNIVHTPSTPYSSKQYDPSTSASVSPGYYIASDGRQYPLSQQPQSERRSPYMSQVGSSSSRYRSAAIPQEHSGMLGGSQDLSPNATTPSAPELFGRRSDNEGKGIAGMKDTYGERNYEYR